MFGVMYAFVLNLVLSVEAFASQRPLAPGPDGYRLIQAIDGISLADKANELAASGYRVAAWDGTQGVIAVLGCLPRGDQRRYRYAAVERRGRQKEWQARLHAVGAMGFRVLPWTTPPNTLLLEKEIGPSAVFEYLVRGMYVRAREKRELRHLEDRGFRLAGILTVAAERGVGAPIALLESSSESRREPGEFRFIWDAGVAKAKSTDKKLANLERRLVESAAEGYRIEAGFGTGGASWDVSLWLRKDATPLKRAEYRIVHDADTVQFGNRVNGAGAEGFRLLPCCAFFAGSDGDLHGHRNGGRVGALLEKTSDGGPGYQYRLFTESDLPGLLALLNSAGSGGFRPRVITPAATGYLVIMEKEGAE